MLDPPVSFLFKNMRAARGIRHVPKIAFSPEGCCKNGNLVFWSVFYSHENSRSRQRKTHNSHSAAISKAFSRCFFTCWFRGGEFFFLNRKNESGAGAAYKSHKIIIRNVARNGPRRSWCYVLRDDFVIFTRRARTRLVFTILAN